MYAAYLKDLLDAAAQDQVATVRRGNELTVFVSADRMRQLLRRATPLKAEVHDEDGWWWAFVPNMPVSADGASFEEAITDLTDALREYAAAWDDHLGTAPNHQQHWGIVQLIKLSDDAQLREWILGTPR
jgi:predicted RNase H-like HicB family nuclease